MYKCTYALVQENNISDIDIEGGADAEKDRELESASGLLQVVILIKTQIILISEEKS